MAIQYFEDLLSTITKLQLYKSQLDFQDTDPYLDLKRIYHDKVSTCSCNFYLPVASAIVMLPVALESGIARIIGQGAGNERSECA